MANRIIGRLLHWSYHFWSLIIGFSEMDGGLMEERSRSFPASEVKSVFVSIVVVFAQWIDKTSLLNKKSCLVQVVNEALLLLWRHDCWLASITYVFRSHVRFFSRWLCGEIGCRWNDTAWKPMLIFPLPPPTNSLTFGVEIDLLVTVTHTHAGNHALRDTHTHTHTHTQTQKTHHSCTALEWLIQKWAEVSC